ncbi:MAG: sodium-translocating pyrophosphatase [Chlorobium sp.]|nr:MAG: sodium-translocating pyrophosphatase [Chlorobium sp.]
MKKPFKVTWWVRALGVLGGLGILLQAPNAMASEADLVLPDLHSGVFLGGIPGDTLLMWGLAICLFGMIFGIVQYMGIRSLPVHNAMREISELIYETCKTYLVTQGKFILVLWVLIGAIIVAYFGWLRHLETIKVVSILIASLIGILGSYTVAWFGMRINTFANSRTAFASLGGKPFPTYAIPLRAGMSIGMLLISIELFVMLCILLFVPNDFAGPCFIGFAIGESLGASVLRIAGGIFTKIADIGSDLMKIVFKIKEDDARNPGVIADCAGDNAGDSVGPTADGFETYGVTGVALISFILLAIKAPEIQVMLLVWIFAMRLVMILASAFSYWTNAAIAKAKYSNADEMNFEKPLITLVWLTSIVSIILTYIASYYLIRTLGDGTMWWKLASIITCGTIAGALIPELVNRFTSTECAHVRNVVQCTKEGGAALNILAGLVAGNFSAYWMGLAIVGLMGTAYGLSTLGITTLGLTPELISAQGIATVGLDKVIMLAPSVFAFGLVAFGFLSMGPVTIAVDSYGPVTDNAQSVYELSLIENVSAKEIENEFGFKPDFTNAKRYLEANDGAGNTFKATAKPVLIGTAVVGSTTMIFSIIMILTNGLADTMAIAKLSILSPPFLLGLMMGGAVIYWFTGASINAVTTGAYYAVEFIKNNIKLDTSVEKASIEDSKKVVEICTKFAQKGMINIFLTVFFTTLAFACLDSFFFIGYLISIALFGLYQAIFMANAGGAWDNAKKLVETELNAKGTDLHDASIVGDTVGDPFKDTSSVALNPIIKFTTLFGLLAIELAIELAPQVALTLAAVFFALSLVFVHRSFFSMRIKVDEH